MWAMILKFRIRCELYSRAPPFVAEAFSEVDMESLESTLNLLFAKPGAGRKELTVAKQDASRARPKKDLMAYYIYELGTAVLRCSVGAWQSFSRYSLAIRLY